VDAASGATVCGPLKRDMAVWDLMFTPDSRRLITTSPRGEVAVWSLPGGTLAAEPVSISSIIRPAEIGPDGKRFATGSDDGVVRLWDAATGRIVFEMPHGPDTNSLDFSADGSLLASAGEDRVVRLWDTRAGKLVRELKGHQNEVMTAMFSPDGRRVVSASTDFTARVWDVATGNQLFVLPHQGEVLDACYSPDGRRVATASRDRTAVLWDAATGRSRSGDLSHEQSVRNVRFSPDGKRLLTLDLSGLRLWDVATGHPLTVMLPQTVVGRLSFQSNGLRPAFTSDGQGIFLAGGSPVALIWHVPVPPKGVPAWFPEFLEAVAGQRLADDTRRPELVPSERFLTLQRHLQASTEADYHSRWARQWLDAVKMDVNIASKQN
jgi:WD40 repeat protein